MASLRETGDMVCALGTRHLMCDRIPAHGRTINGLERHNKVELAGLLCHAEHLSCWASVERLRLPSSAYCSSLYCRNLELLHSTTIPNEVAPSGLQLIPWALVVHHCIGSFDF